MDDFGGAMLLLVMGPLIAYGFYRITYRRYRNRDESYAFEDETAVEVLMLSGSEHDHKVDENNRTPSGRIKGANHRNHRERVLTM